MAGCLPVPDRRTAITGLLAAAGRGELQSVVHEQLPLEHPVLAHQKMAAGEVFGRLALTPSGSQVTPALCRRHQPLSAPSDGDEDSGRMPRTT